MHAPEELYGEGTTRQQVINAETSLTLPFMWNDLNFRYNTTARLQLEQTSLLPQDRFSIGGRYTVRGFDGESSLVGDGGLLLRNELGWILNGSYKEPYLGLDLGRVTGTSKHVLEGKALVGAVMGFKGSWKGLYYDLFYGASLYHPNNFKSENSFGFTLNCSF